MKEFYFVTYTWFTMCLKEIGNWEIFNKNTCILLLIIIIRRKKRNIHRIGNTAIAVCGTYFADSITYFIT